MKATSKTLYIPLYGKAFVSRRGILLHDSKAEEIWSRENLPLHGKAKSKWLAYFMGMRAAAIDDWTRAALNSKKDAAVLHLGCGLDARAHRLEDAPFSHWYDVDFPEVIRVRGRYYQSSPRYTMLAGGVSAPDWIENLPQTQNAVVVMEGLIMYLTIEELKELFARLQAHFAHVSVIADAYTLFAVKASKFSNPVRSVGAEIISGLDDPGVLEINSGIRFQKQLSLTPEEKIQELPKFDARFFRTVFAGKATDKLYRLYTYEIERI